MMRFLQLIALAALVCGWSAQAADEAALYRQVRLLQAAPEPAQRAWLEELLDYRSQELTDLGESREAMLVPAYPVAAAARAALLALDVHTLVQEFVRSEPTLPARWDSPAQERAWAQWITQSEQLPAAVEQAGPASVWPERVLRAIASHPAAGPQWTLALLRTASEGASLRWIDATLPTLSITTLKSAATNPATAETVGTEWGRRANRQVAEAIQHLRTTALTAPDTPGLAAGLAVWNGAPDLLANLQKASSGNPGWESLMARVERYRKYLTAHGEPQP